MEYCQLPRQFLTQLAEDEALSSLVCQYSDISWLRRSVGRRGKKCTTSGCNQQPIYWLNFVPLRVKVRETTNGGPEVWRSAGERLMDKPDFFLISNDGRSGERSQWFHYQLSCQFTNEFLLTKSLSVGAAPVFVVIIPSWAELNPLASKNSPAFIRADLVGQ